MESWQVAYTDCSTTSGVLSLDPLVLRFSNKTDGYIYGNSGRTVSTLLFCVGTELADCCRAV